MRTKAPITLLANLVVWLLPAPLLAGAPEQVVSELNLWRQAVASQDPARIAGRMVKGQTVTFHSVGRANPAPAPVSLTGLELRRRLEDGQADALGLCPLLLLPRAAELKSDGKGHWVATDKRCPEVRWVFEKRGARWRLGQVWRHHLGC